MFSIVEAKGFRLTFANGYTISVQFGPGNYCERRDEPYGAPREAIHGVWSSSDAEIAIWDAQRNWQTERFAAVILDDPNGVLGDDVAGRVNADRVARIIDAVQSADPCIV